jgi:glycosyltransferase involved in cell wall biosynthesis
MRIAYDGMPFTYNWTEGMLVYNRQLLTHLFDLFPENDYSFFFNSLRQDFADIDLPGRRQQTTRTVMRFPSLPWPGLGLKIYFDLALPRFLRKHRVDLFHGLRYHVPTAIKTRVVTTFHDIFAQVMPDTFSPDIITERRLWYRRAVDRSDRIIASSAATKDDIVRYYGVPEEKIVVVHLAAALAFKPMTDHVELDQVRRRHHIDFDYILALGSHPIRKNTERILRALAQLRQNDECHHKLALFGVGPQQQQKWAPLIELLGLANHVIFLHPVTNEDLPVLYSMADLFVYPSLYEGFGIPILEAMSCGTPVITSNMSSMAEVAGGAARLIDPLSVDELTDAIRSLLADKAAQKELAELSLKRAQEFSWEKTARQTMAVYESIV